jgi:hypothetical protein
MKVEEEYVLLICNLVVRVAFGSCRGKYAAQADRGVFFFGIYEGVTPFHKSFGTPFSYAKDARKPSEPSENEGLSYFCPS